MVPLPLFKLAALFVRHVSKYGANRIKIQAHEHPQLRHIAAKYGQTIHQITMRVSVASMRDVTAEKRAKEKAEAPTVKTEEQVKAEAEKASKAGTEATKEKSTTHEAKKSIWTRKFRPLPEAKAVDLFADVVGDAFILLVAGGLITYEYVKAKAKPDQNMEMIAELAEQLKEEERRMAELEEREKQQQHRVEALEQALELLKNERAPGKLKRALHMS